MSLLICLEVIAEGEGIDTGPVADLSLRTHREGPLHESALRILDDAVDAGTRGICRVGRPGR
jgi:hypothetical protein